MKHDERRAEWHAPLCASRSSPPGAYAPRRDRDRACCPSRPRDERHSSSRARARTRTPAALPHDLRCTELLTEGLLRKPTARPFWLCDDPGVPHYVYRVVVDGEHDDELIASNEPIPIEAEVPFRGRTVIVEEIEDLHETDASGRDLAELIEAQPETQIVRTLICREAERD